MKKRWIKVTAVSPDKTSTGSALLIGDIFDDDVPGDTIALNSAPSRFPQNGEMFNVIVNSERIRVINKKPFFKTILTVTAPNKFTIAAFFPDLGDKVYFESDNTEYMITAQTGSPTFEFTVSPNFAITPTVGDTVKIVRQKLMRIVKRGVDGTTIAHHSINDRIGLMFESEARKFLIRYDDDGNILLDTPNIPAIAYDVAPVSSGRTINIIYIYDTAKEAVVATKLQTRIKKYETGVITNQTSAAMAAAVKGIRSGSRAIPSGSDGWFQVSARSETAGGAFSEWSEWTEPVWCSNVVSPAVTGIVVNVVG